MFFKELESVRLHNRRSMHPGNDVGLTEKWDPPAGFPGTSWSSGAWPQLRGRRSCGPPRQPSRRPRQHPPPPRPLPLRPAALHRLKGRPGQPGRSLPTSLGKRQERSHQRDKQVCQQEKKKKEKVQRMRQDNNSARKRGHTSEKVHGNAE